MRARRKRAPVAGASWRWVYDGRCLIGVLQQLGGDRWRAIRVDPDVGRDREMREFECEADALRFINDPDPGGAP